VLMFFNACIVHQVTNNLPRWVVLVNWVRNFP
jgi:hypothetical protein